MEMSTKLPGLHMEVLHRGRRALKPGKGQIRD